MSGAGIHGGDLLILDRSIRPSHGDIVIAIGEDGPIVRRFIHPQRGRPELIGQVQRQIDIVPCTERVSQILGVVTRCIHQTRHG